MKRDQSGDTIPSSAQAPSERNESTGNPHNPTTTEKPAEGAIRKAGMGLEKEAYGDDYEKSEGDASPNKK